MSFTLSHPIEAEKEAPLDSSYTTHNVGWTVMADVPGAFRCREAHVSGETKPRVWVHGTTPVTRQ